MMIRQKSVALVLLLLLSSKLLISQTPPVDNTPSALTRRILILNEINPSSPTIPIIDEARAHASLLTMVPGGG